MERPKLRFKAVAFDGVKLKETLICAGKDQPLNGVCIMKHTPETISLYSTDGKILAQCDLHDYCSDEFDGYLLPSDVSDVEQIFISSSTIEAISPTIAKTHKVYGPAGIIVCYQANNKVKIEIPSLEMIVQQDEVNSYPDVVSVMNRIEQNLQQGYTKIVVNPSVIEKLYKIAKQSGKYYIELYFNHEEEAIYYITGEIKGAFMPIKQ
jgi:hypothetical protein